MVFIRTDANDVIATGHVMRCMTIAEEIGLLGENVTFVVSDEQSVYLPREKGFQVICLNTTWDMLDNEKEYEKIQEILGKESVLLIDTYSVTPKYICEMKKYAKVVCFDDLCEQIYPADILINYNIFYPIFHYEKKYKDFPVKLLLGTKYVPLRKQFRLSVSKEIKKREILLISGGGDALNVMGNLLQKLQKKDSLLLNDFIWNIVGGKYNKNIDMLQYYAEKHKNIKLYVNVDNIAELMGKCDVCISAASTVLYECCALKLPTIFFIVANDQQYDAVFFSKENMMIYCGDYRKDKEQVLNQMENSVNMLMNNKEEKELMKDKMSCIVDGKGAKRIAESMCGLIAHS